MKFYRSIRFRIWAGILAFGVLLVLFNSIVTFMLLGKTLDRLVNNLLGTEIDYFLYQYEKDRTAPLPHSKYIKVFKGIDRVPENFKGLFQDLEPGVHSLRPNKKRPPVHVGVIKLPDTRAVYYLRFHGRAFFEENEFLSPHEILLISLALVLIPGSIIGIIMSWLAFRPVKALMDKIQGLNPENIPDKWADGPQSGEIRMLTSTIESAMARIREFITREKQFTRDASHELRTPLTVVKGAVEIMEDQSEVAANPMLGKPLARISRSVRDMETMIETFLWLAREENEPGQSARVAEAVEKAVADNRYIVEDKDVKLELDIRYSLVLPVKEEILYITLANLVRNAFQFTAKGSVSIVSEKEYISITDTGAGIEPDRLDGVTHTHIKGSDSQGFGLGLGIVSRLCKRFGWELTLHSWPGEGTQAKIKWGGTGPAR